MEFMRMIYFCLFFLRHLRAKIKRLSLNLTIEMIKKAIYTVLCMIYPFTVCFSENGTDKTVIPTRQVLQMDERITELMADRVEFKKNLPLEELAIINEARVLNLRRKEELIFPAEEFYGTSWDDKKIIPTQKDIYQHPDSCEVDCSSFVLPIDIASKITSKYGPRGRRMHNGIDLKVYVGDTIRSAFDGRVRIRSYNRYGYGYYLVIRHPNGLETVYGHLSKFIAEKDQIVRAGDPIGLGGNTGRSTGSHLHFETRFLGNPINPAEFFDFENAVPHKDTYVLRNMKVRGKNTNRYTTSTQQTIYHRVKSGDSLGRIAHIYGTSISHLCYLNGLKSTSVIHVGQMLRCSMTVAGKKTMSNLVNVKGKPSVNKAKYASKQYIYNVPPADASTMYHNIQSGDTLGGIAIKYGTTVSKLCNLNGLSRTTTLRIGRKIRCS